MRHLSSHPRGPQLSGPSSRQRGRAIRPRAIIFRPHLEALEDRTLLSTIAYQVPAGTVGQQAFNGPLGMDFNVVQPVVVTRLGVFDSGVGGLTVVRALAERLPKEEIVYLGDTARVPYGSKSAETVARYSRNAARFLVGEGVKMIVIACNTASALALDA